MNIRTRKLKDPFTRISNALITDKRLKWKERGLLCYLLSLPNDWKININHLVTMSPGGKKEIQSSFSSLKELGYAELKTLKGKDGVFKGKEWIVYESPIEAVLKKEISTPTDNAKMGTSAPTTPFSDCPKNGQSENRTVLKGRCDYKLLRDTNYLSIQTTKDYKEREKEENQKNIIKEGEHTHNTRTINNSNHTPPVAAHPLKNLKEKVVESIEGTVEIEKKEIEKNYDETIAKVKAKGTKMDFPVNYLTASVIRNIQNQRNNPKRTKKYNSNENSKTEQTDTAEYATIPAKRKKRKHIIR